MPRSKAKTGSSFFTSGGNGAMFPLANSANLDSRDQSIEPACRLNSALSERLVKSQREECRQLIEPKLDRQFSATKLGRHCREPAQGQRSGQPGACRTERLAG